MPEPQPIAVPETPVSGRRFTGPNASVWKYDLLTALSVYALGQGACTRTTMLRLIAAVTARYDWRRDELSVGRVELTRLWQCSESTVKRELRRLRGLELLVQIRAASRGRVAAYRLGKRAIEDLTGGCWDLAGRDFNARMGEVHMPNGNVVGFPSPDRVSGGGQGMPAWATMVTGGDPAIFRNWFSNVKLSRDGDVATFCAPSAFVASQIETRFFRKMQEAVRYHWPDIREIRIEFR